MKNGRHGVGIAGLGLIARTHATAYRANADRVDLVAVCDADPEVAERFGDEFGCRSYTAYSDLIADPEVDALDLILPHFLHKQAALDVIAAGKHLLLEKPVAPNYPDSVEIYRRARESAGSFMVAENTRYIAAYRVVADLLAQGAIGDVIHVRTQLRSNEKLHLSQAGNWRTKYELGGGLLLDTGAHSFYLLAWLLGEVAELRAVGRKVFPLPNPIEDTAEVTGLLKSGAHFSCMFTSVSEAPHSERLELYGSTGVILMDQAQEPVVRLFAGDHDYLGRAIDGAPFALDAWHPGGWHFESVLVEVEDFIGSLAEGREPEIDSRDAVYAIGVVDAAYRSIRSDQSLIDLRGFSREDI
ncbi:MAG: Gfo/Idh/MocA family oxidoreductase [Bifidobacteriaceae bacterium]|jgi:predicted dehydrogenase|nr:Gfo/Idh/MocA family oxidoreductase [Bifidobacteriaceae bacterium]